MVKQPLPNLLVLALSVFAKKADRVVVNIEFSPVPRKVCKGPNIKENDEKVGKESIT